LGLESEKGRGREGEKWESESAEVEEKGRGAVGQNCIIA